MISKHPTGSARNHCPFCLYSKHVDKEFPGDRASECPGLMAPVGFESRKGRGTVVVHECEICKKRIVNKLAPDDDYLPLYQKFAAYESEKLRH